MNISTLNLENAHLFLEEYDIQNNRIEEVKEYKEYECKECFGDLAFTNHFLTCIDCGLTDLDTCERYYLDDPEMFIRKRSFYKRKLYAMEKLNLMTCRKPCKKPTYLKSVKTLSECDFETIFELKKLMKDFKMNKLYPYIYLIYFDIKKIKLINLTCSQVDNITTEFVKTEMKFKCCGIKRKNMLSYYSLIYLTMKHLNYTGYENIILPNNFSVMQESYNAHLVGTF